MAAVKDFTSTIVTSLGSVVIGMMGFWMVEARDYIKRDEAIQIITEQSPYTKDKSLIMSEINRANQSNKDLEIAVRQTNDVLMQLKIEMAVLNKTLQNIHEREQAMESALLKRESQDPMSKALTSAAQ